jgi:hypothetical protein
LARAPGIAGDNALPRAERALADNARRIVGSARWRREDGIGPLSMHNDNLHYERSNSPNASRRAGLRPKLRLQCDDEARNEHRVRY